GAAVIAKDNAGLTVTTPTAREIVMTRTFDAPRQLIFEAWTKPEHLQRWFGAPGWTLTVCEIDLRPGGIWRFVMRKASGKEMEIRGVYREIVPPERIVSTETAGCDVGHQEGNEILSTVSFAEQNRKTMLTHTLLYPSSEIRDAVMGTGMQTGVAASY